MSIVKVNSLAVRANKSERRLVVRWLLVVALFGVPQTTYAYRTGGDLDDFDDTKRVAWNVDTVNFNLVDDYPGSLASNSALGDEVRDAMAAWTDVDCSSIHVGLSGWVGMDAVYGDGENTIQWVSSGWEDRGFLKDAAGATDIRYELIDDEWTIVEADVYLNAENHEWTLGVGSEDRREAAGVLAHELGHALGLLHPCKEEGEPKCTKEQRENPPTMYPAYSQGQLTLEPDDRAGICFLYPTCTTGSCGDGESCTDFGCVDICADGICGTGEACIDDECIDISDPCAVGDPSCENCEADKECGADYVCVEGQCKTTLVPQGDPCTKDSQCESNVCLDKSYCSTHCTRNSDCGDEGECDTDESRCEVDSRGPFGDECDSADDCLGTQCVADLTDTPLCTRTCSAKGIECPFDWICGDVDGESVCRPTVEPWVEGGCACGLNRQRPKRSHLFFLLSGAALMFARRLRASERFRMMGKAL